MTAKEIAKLYKNNSNNKARPSYNKATPSKSAIQIAKENKNNFFGTEAEIQNYSDRIMEVAELLKKNPDFVGIKGSEQKITAPLAQGSKAFNATDGRFNIQQTAFPKQYVPKDIYDAAVKFNEKYDKAVVESEKAEREQKRKNLLIAFTAKNGVIMGDDPRLNELLDPNDPRLGTVGQAIKDFGTAPKAESEEELGVLDAAKKQKILDDIIGFKKFQNETPGFKKQPSDIIEDITKPKQLDGQTFYNSYALNRHLKDKELQSITEKAAQEISKKYWLAGDISEFASKPISDEEAKSKRLNADIHNIVNGHKAVSVRDENYKYSKLTDDEKMLYNYFVMEQTPDMKTSLAGRYLKSLELGLEQRAAVDKAESMNGFEKGLYLFGHGIGGSLENIANIGGDFGYDPTEGELLASAIIEGEEDGFAKFVYQSISTISEQIPALAVGFATGGAGYSAVLSADIMSQSIKEAMQNNKTLIQGVSYGAVQASMELALERMLGGIGGKFLGKGSSSIVVKTLNKIDDIFTSKIPKALLKGAVVRLENGFGEFTQEFIQGITDPAIKNIIYQENNTYSLGTLNEALYQGLLGAVSGMFLGGGVNATQTTAYYETLGNSLSDSQVLDFAKEAGNVKSELYRELSEKARKGKELTAAERGMLSKETTDLVYNNSTFTKETLKFMATEGSVKQISDVLFGGNTEAAEIFKSKFSDSEYVDSIMFGENYRVDASFVEKALNHTVPETAATEAMAEGQTVPTAEGEATAEAETVGTDTEAATDSIAHPAPTAGKVLKMTPVSAKAKNYVKDIAKRLGTNLEFVDMAAELAKRGQNVEGLVIYPEGFYDPKTHTIYVGNEVANPVEFVFKHELTHYGERSKYYADFARAVRDSKAFKKWLDTQATYTTKDAAGKELQLHLVLKERYKKVKNLTEPEAQREVIANFVADVLFKGDVDTLSEILNEATPTRKNAVMRFLSDFFSWLKSKFTGSKQIVSEIADLENKFRELIGDAVADPMPTESGITYDTAETEANESMSVAEADTDSMGAKLSKDQRKYFALSKVRDAYGRLIRLYHGTANGEFYTFDKAKGDVEGDFGSGFYFTNNENDVTKNYEGGGPDFEAKVRRRADKIVSERGIEYSQAEQIARKELYKGSFKHTVYLNIENPAIVGETNLLDPRKYLEQTNNDYEAARAQAEKDISKITLALKYKFGIKNISEITDLLWKVTNQGGIGIEQLKSEVRKLRLQDNSGNSIGNEVTRQIIESLGYDGIIDSTVSDKWNMDTEVGTTHYIVFNSEQIKSVDNKNPSNKKDIRYSVPASEGEAQTNYKAELGRLLQRLQNEEITQEEYMSEVSKLYQKSVDENGQIKQGEMVTPENKPYPVPKKVKEGTAVRGFVRTVMETGKATPEIASHFEQLILSGEFDHTPTSNEKRINAAVQKINTLGYQQALDNWYKTNDKLLTSDKNNIAVGEALLNLAFEHKNVADIMNLTAELAEIGTRTAQDLQAMKLLKRMGGIAQLVYIQKAVAKTNQNLEKRFSGRFERRGIPVPVVKINETMANQLAECSTESEYEVVYKAIMQDIANQVPSTFLDKFTAWRYMSMLFSVTTHIRNFLGNAIFLPMVRMKNVIGKVIELTRPKDQRTKSVTVKKAYKDFAEKDFAEVKDLISGSGKYNPSDQIDEYRKIFKTRWLEALRKFNFKALEKEDAFFLKRHYRHSLGGYLQAQGIDLNNISQKQLRKARDYAIQEALKATYRDTNKVANVLSQLSHTSVLGNVLIEGVMPFKKTPLNIVKRGIEYSPAGLLKTTLDGIRLLRGGTITASEWVDGLASNLTGMGVFLLGFWLSSMGIVKAGFDDEDERFRKMNGEQEYSIEILGHSYTMSWAAPMCIPFFMGSAMEEYDPDEDGDLLSTIGDIVLSGFEPVLELSCLSGINDAIQGVKYAAEGEIPGLVMHSVKSFASQLLPTMLGKVANLFDDTRRTTYIDKTSDIPELAQEALDKLASKFPGATYTRAEYIDAWGREKYTGNFIERFFQQFVSPGYASTVDKSKISEELRRIYKATDESGVYPDTPKKTVKVGGEDRRLSKEEYYNVATMSGQTKMNLVNEAMDHKYYDKLTDEQKADVIMNIYKYSNNLAVVSELDFTLDEVKAGLGDKGDVLTESRWNGFSFEQQQYLTHEAFMDGVITAYKYEQNGGSAAEYFILKALRDR